MARRLTGRLSDRTDGGFPDPWRQIRPPQASRPRERALGRPAVLAVAVCFAVGGFAAVGLPAAHGDESWIQWPGKSGPAANGNVLSATADRLPSRWDFETGEHVVWQTPWEGFGHSTPVVGEGRVWFTSATEDGKRQFVEGFRESDGSRLHHKLLFENADPEPLGNAVNNYAAPTPALEPGALYVHFGTYGTARLDPETADVVWQRRDIHARHFRGPGSSPVIFENLLVLTFDGIDRQFLTALDKHTGQTVWRTDRSTDYGDLDADGLPKLEGDLRKGYSTPAIVEVNGRPQVISVGAKAAFGYDARTGEEIWTVTHDGYNAAAQPLIFRDMAILHTGSRAAQLLAVRLGSDTTGDVTDSHVVWERDRGNSRLSFPVMVRDRIVWLTDTGVAVAVDAATGREWWSQRLGGNFIASPLVAGSRVYFFSSDGETIVADAGGDKLEVLWRGEIPGGVTASPAASDDGLILRTRTHLVKIAGSSDE